MIKKEQITHVSTVDHIYCDDCNNKIRKGYSNSTSCEICKKDLCQSCVEHVEYDGDYSTVYCKNCWTIGEEYRNLIAIHEGEIEGLYSEWHGKCKVKN